MLQVKNFSISRGLRSNNYNSAQSRGQWSRKSGEKRQLRAAGKFRGKEMGDRQLRQKNCGRARKKAGELRRRQQIEINARRL